MKKLCILMVLAVFLAGCGKNSYETRTALCDGQDSPAPGVISIQLPDEVAAPVMSTQTGDRLYIADNYEITLQTMSGGDLNATLKSCTGFQRDDLTVLQTQKDGLKRYDCAWTSAGEGTQTVGRMTVLDDGYYHYVLAVTAPQDHASDMNEAWMQLSESFQISTGQ